MRLAPLRPTLAALALVAATLAGAPAASPAGAGAEAATSFHPLPPTRVVDTRTGTGTGAGPLAAGSPRTLTLAGGAVEAALGIPAGAAAVVATLTVTGTTSASHLTAWPADQARPTASNLNWPAGDTRANLAVLPLSADGRVEVAVGSGSAHLVVDVVGWFDSTTPDAPGLHPLPPTRSVDTRHGVGTTEAPLAAGEARIVTLAGTAGVPEHGATAVVANLTVTETTAASHLTAWPADQPRPTASNLNWPAGDTRANLAVLPLSPDGEVALRSPAGATEVVIDVVGFLDTPLGDLPGLTTTTPQRVLDTRTGLGTRAAGLGAADIRTVALAGVPGVPAGATAVVANLTVTDTTAASHLTAWPADRARPTASNLNWPAGDTRAVLAVLPVSPDGEVALFNQAGGAHVVIDVVGWLTSPALDVHLEGAGTLAGVRTVTVHARGATPTQVALHLDGPSGPVLGTSTSAPATFAVDSTTIANGPHTLVAVASVPGREVSATVAITVDNRSYDWSAVSATMRRKVANVPLDGNAVLVAHHGEVVFEDAAGTTTAQTVVPIASATKWLSAAVIMRLVDRGVLHLDQRVSDVLPGFGGAKASITLRQLLSFTSGLAPDVDCSGQAGWTLETCVADAAARPLVALPGTQFRYGSTHLVVAARMAEVVTGRTWDELFTEELVVPLGLTATALPRKVNPNPAGGAISNLTDYARFVRVMWNGGVLDDGTRYLSPAAIDQMQRDQTRGATMVGLTPLRKGIGSRYGLGEWWDPLGGGRSEVNSPGKFGFMGWVDRERDLYAVYAVYLNTDDDLSAGGWEVKDAVRAAVDG